MTIINFQPTANGPFVFQPVLDDETYTAIVTWAIWGQRWYLNLYSSAGPLVVATAIVGSVDPISTPLTTTFGLATASVASVAGLGLGWSVASRNVADPTDLVAITPAGIVRLSEPATVSGEDSDAAFSWVNDLVAGFGFASTLAFYPSSQTFVTSP